MNVAQRNAPDERLSALHHAVEGGELLAAAGGRLDAIFFCPHAADSNCECRKPKPGLLREIGSRFGIELKGVPMVGVGSMAPLGF